MSGALLVAEGVGLDYADGGRRVRAVDDVSLEIGRGEFVGLVGPSGSGKSSLLYLLGGLRAPSRGEVRLDGVPWPDSPERSAARRRRSVGFLFQEPFLVPWLTAGENALVHVEDEGALGRVRALADALGVGDLLASRPGRLSGGERQRIAILRALAGDPDLVLADEPTAALDRATGRTVMEALRARAQDAALLVVTHDPAMLSGADRVLEILDGRLSETSTRP